GQGCERPARPAGGRADDHEVIALDRLDLQPERAPLAGDVRGVTMLGHDPLQPTIQASLVQLDALLLDVVRHEQAAPRGDGALEPGPAPVHRRPNEWPAVQVQGVESEVRERRGVDQCCTALQPPPERLAIRTTLLVCDDQLAVEDGPEGYLPGQVVQLGEEPGDVAEPAILQANAAVPVNEQQAAEAIPLDLEQVLIRAEGRLG